MGRFRIERQKSLYKVDSDKGVYIALLGHRELGV